MSTQKKKLSLEPYRGTRDFYPEDMFIQNYIFGVMRSVVERFGYVEYGASLLEESALYAAKSGEELVNEQTYAFVDRGGRNVTIRPEMTPTVARMVARRQKELAFPLRWYSIPNLFRYERPQRGRLREHWQLNVDLFGSTDVRSDVELISVAHAIMREFGAKESQFVIKINNRRLLQTVFQDILHLEEDQVYRVSKLIDRKNKMDEHLFVKELQELVPLKHAAIIELLDAASVKALLEILPELKDTEGLYELQKVFYTLFDMNIKNTEFDFTLMRGFDYYTGTIFEVFDTGTENNRALFGGGRYDDLLDIFGVEKVPAVGFGMGDVAIRDFLETYGLLPAYQSRVQLYVCTVDDSAEPFVQKVVSLLRKKNISVERDLSSRKVGSQIKAADNKKIPFVVCVGEQEAASKVLRVKDLRTGAQEEVPLNKLATFIKKNI